jgi:hypothetical protein
MTSVAIARQNHQALSPGARILESWRLEITAANNAFIHGRHARAFNHYNVALELANAGITGMLNLTQIDFLEEAERHIAALVVTRHNLADLCQQAGQRDSAVEHLCAAHETLFQLLHHQSKDVHVLAQRHSNVTYQELLNFVQRFGQELRIQQSLLLTKYACVCCRQKVTH